MVFLFVPNIIGYVRFAFLLATFFTYQSNPYLTVAFYALSQILDAFDGMAARKFNQCTKFGSVLDMVCDRASNAVLLAVLAGLYPSYAWFFLADIVLDLTSHWFQMYAALLCGEHHKESKTDWKLLNIYYGSKPVLFALVAGNQVFLIGAYLLIFTTGTVHTALLFLTYFGLAFFLTKKLMSVIQLISASQKIAEWDTVSRSKKQ